MEKSTEQLKRTQIKIWNPTPNNQLLNIAKFRKSHPMVS